MASPVDLGKKIYYFFPCACIKAKEKLQLFSNELDQKPQTLINLHPSPLVKDNCTSIAVLTISTTVIILIGKTEGSKVSYVA